MKGGSCEIDGGISSQFISALLIACPLCDKPSEIKVKNLKSSPYVDMTLDILQKSGIEVLIKNSTYVVPPSQTFSLSTYTVPSDFSSASYILAASSILPSRVRLMGMFPSLQADERIVDVLREMGADVHWDREKGIVDVRGGNKLRGAVVDVSQCPDLTPTVAALGVHAEGVTVIENASHVRLKETDRI